jgi:multidrug efflux system membrane fusion protein
MPARVLALALAALLLTFSDARAEPVEAYTRARLDVSLGFVVSGRVQGVLVEEGQRVSAGDPLVRLADPEGEAQIRLLELRAVSTLEIDAAEADYDLAKVREEMVKGAAEQGGASAFEVREAELETVRARLARDLFIQRRAEAQLQLEQARRRHEQFTLRAPAAGVVDQIEIEPGETVQSLEPVARLVATDALVADAQAPTADTLGLAPGDPARVVFLLGEERTETVGRVRAVALVGDAASDTRRVRVEIPNDRNLPAGTRVLLVFDDAENPHGP